MGNLVWHDWARFVSITASVYTVWSGFWAMFFRKFFWDFVGGIMRDPGGIQPSPAVSVFITLIVKAPIVQIVAMVLGMINLAIELPLPQLEKLAIHRSFVFRIVLLLFQSFLTILYYQGTNACIWSLVALMAYTNAQLKGEVMEEAKNNRGQGGKA